MKLKKAPLVYFARKGPMNPVANYAIDQDDESRDEMFYVAQWIYLGKSKELETRTFEPGFKTLAEAEALASKYNEGLVHACPWHEYEEETV